MVYEELRSLSANWGRPITQQQQGRDTRTSESSLPWPWRRTARASASSALTAGGDSSSVGGKTKELDPATTQLRQPSSTEIVCIGALSKLVATVITYPNQVCQTQRINKLDQFSLIYCGPLCAVKLGRQHYCVPKTVVIPHK